MGIFDNLIDKNTKTPNPDMEYIYRMDMVWTPNSIHSKPIKIGTIMNNVIKKENGSFEFINKETGELLCTNYGWSLAENTPENIKRIKDYEKEYVKFRKHELKIYSLRDSIITLKK